MTEQEIAKLEKKAEKISYHESREAKWARRCLELIAELREARKEGSQDGQE